MILTHIGDTRHAAGDLPQARQALNIFEDIKHPSADQVRAKLGRTYGTAPPKATSTPKMI